MIVLTDVACITLQISVNKDCIPSFYNAHCSSTRKKEFYYTWVDCVSNINCIFKWLRGWYIFTWYYISLRNYCSRMREALNLILNFCFFLFPWMSFSWLLYESSKFHTIYNLSPKIKNFSVSSWSLTRRRNSFSFVTE